MDQEVFFEWHRPLVKTVLYGIQRVSIHVTLSYIFYTSITLLLLGVATVPYFFTVNSRPGDVPSVTHTGMTLANRDPT